MKNFASGLVWGILGILFATLFIFFLYFPVRNNGGDIVEYFGMNESLLKSHTVQLTDITLGTLQQVLHPAYFDNANPEQNGGLLYYMEGKNKKRYPVHFFFYSLLALPVRVILHLFSQNELNTLRLTNLVLLFGMAFIAMRYFLDSIFKRAVFLLLVSLSPIVWFIIWPGPDVYYVSMLMIALFLFFKKRYILSTILIGMASWHSQPLIILTLLSLLYYVYKATNFQIANRRIYMGLNKVTIGVIIGILALTLLPYLYNYWAFGVLTPWTILKDGWTQIYGFGLQNASVQKTLELFVDLNMGLFWYAPILLLAGLYYAVKAALHQKVIFLLLAAFSITAIFYQTNPAWHYGTSGYGPTRHILFFLPLLIYFLVEYARPKVLYFLVLVAFIATQLYIMSWNGYLAPEVHNVLNHTPYAKYVLDHYPALYNPTPEIFVDRSNHVDLKVMHSAIYTYNGKCTKAYVLKTDIELIEKLCGKIPAQYKAQLENEFTRKTSFPRKTFTTHATFWPDSIGCAKEYVTSEIHPYVCMRTLDLAVKNIGLEDSTRLLQAPDMEGVWVLLQGDPVKITVPAGYFITHVSQEGIYVNF